jgi:hypothetical protein
MPTIRTTDIGTCYAATFELLLQMPDDAILVHGYPRCTDPAHRGKKMGHAWIEVERLGQRWCVDHKHPDRLVHQRVFYHVGQIDESECKRYTKHRSGDTGPWGRQPKDAHFAERCDDKA